MMRPFFERASGTNRTGAAITHLVRTSSLSVLLLIRGLCLGSPGDTSTVETSEELSGGAATVFDDTRNAFTFPSPNLSADHRTQFFVGNSFFNQNWVAATPA